VKGKKRGKNCLLSSDQAIPGLRLTLEIPRPPFTPRPLSNHHRPAPAIPAAPVPVDQAPRAVCGAARDGYVVVICRKLSSPSPEESEARAIPKSRGGTVWENAIVCGISQYSCLRLRLTRRLSGADDAHDDT
jgi:hypothetical protein